MIFRRCVSLVVLVLGLALCAAPASAANAPATVCTVSDKRITELSGLVSDGEHWYAINDGGSKVQVFVLGRDCVVQRVITNSTDPYDVEDLARGRDGTLWLSDTGDNNKDRATVALLAVTPQGRTTLYRLTYPDGAHDVEALLLDPKGTPYLVTKNPFGDTGVYRPVAGLQSPGPTALERVTSLQFKPTSTQGGPVGAFGTVLVTGGATSADGRVIALRTYTDAYLYWAPDGDVPAALSRDPVRVALPNEQQGEAIAFEPDGTLLSGGEGVGQPIRAIPGATALVTPATEAGPRAVGEATPPIHGEASPPTGGEAASNSPGEAGGSGGMGALPGLLLALSVAGVAAYAWTKLRRRPRD